MLNAEYRYRKHCDTEIRYSRRYILTCVQKLPEDVECFPNGRRDGFPIEKGGTKLIPAPALLLLSSCSAPAFPEEEQEKDRSWYKDDKRMAKGWIYRIRT